MRISGLLFDKDGTLVDYEKSWAAVNRQAARLGAAGDATLARVLLEGCGVDPGTGRTIADSPFAAGNAVDIARRMAALGSPCATDALAAALDRLFARSAGNAVPVCPLRPLFGRLRRQGARLGVASSDNAASIHATLAAQEVAGMVDFVAGHDSGHGAKPEPGMVLAFCAATGLSPGDVAVVGDNRHDLAMGRAAGCGAVIGVLTGTGTRASLEPVADFCLPSIEALPALLEAQAGGPA